EMGTGSKKVPVIACEGKRRKDRQDAVYPALSLQPKHTVRFSQKADLPSGYGVPYTPKPPLTRPQSQRHGYLPRRMLRGVAPPPPTRDSRCDSGANGPNGTNMAPLIFENDTESRHQPG